jgi:dienelactone hydrolase
MIAGARAMCEAQSMVALGEWSWDVSGTRDCVAATLRSCTTAEVIAETASRCRRHAFPLRASQQKEVVRHGRNGSIEPFKYHPDRMRPGDSPQYQEGNVREMTMRRLGCAIALLALLLCPVAADTAPPGLIQQNLMLPIVLPNGSQVRLEAVVTRPDQPGRFPLVVLVHGTPRAIGEALRAAMAQQSPAVLLGPAIAFAQHGYAAVSIMRRGFGRSEGRFAEALSGTCDNRDYLAVGRIAAEDVTGAVATLRVQPWVDPDRVLLLGLSTGGFAVTAAAADNPSGVVGILNFAGGHGSAGPDRVCSPNHLVEDVAILGRTARVPALWIYSDNDHYIPAALGRSMFEAYVASGAPAQLRILPPFGVEGHTMLAVGPAELWWPSVEGFLNGLHLPTSLVIELPPRAALPAPAPLNAACVNYFDYYVRAPTDIKAFAWNREGHCSSVAFRRTIDEAKEEAMRQCVEAWKQCSLYAVGQALAPG